MFFKEHVFVNARKSLDLIDPSNHYIRSYPELLEATQCLVERYGEKAVPMVAHLVYGWMPKILSYSRDKYQDDVIIKAVECRSRDDALQVLDQVDYPPTNNAWVGMSKTLHFLNPEVFPIWDSKVAAVLGVPSTKMGVKEVYKSYTGFVFEHIEDSFVEEVIAGFEERAGYKISKVRAVEFVLFIAGEV